MQMQDGHRGGEGPSSRKSKKNQNPPTARALENLLFGFPGARAQVEPGQQEGPGSGAAAERGRAGAFRNRTD